jgi:hypothetical protein
MLGLSPLPPTHDKRQASVAPIIEQKRMATILEEVKFLNWVPYVPHGHKMCPCAIILPYFAQINQGFCMTWAQNRGTQIWLSVQRLSPSQVKLLEDFPSWVSWVEVVGPYIMVI